MQSNPDSFAGEKIKKESAVDKLCSILREQILSGTWRTNEKIPTEHELAERFGLNRMTVRAALQRLNALGILETRVGDGTYVRAFDFTDLIANISNFYTSMELLDDVWEFRKIVEGGSARLIIDNGTEEDLAELRRISEEMTAAQNQLIEAGGYPDSDAVNHMYQLIFLFHEQLFKMTHNKLLYYAHAVSKDAVCQALMISGQQREEHYFNVGTPEKLKFHEKIVELIVAKDYDACQEAITKYVSREIAYW